MKFRMSKRFCFSFKFHTRHLLTIFVRAPNAVMFSTPLRQLRTSKCDVAWRRIENLNKMRTATQINMFRSEFRTPATRQFETILATVANNPIIIVRPQFALIFALDHFLQESSR